MEEKSDKSKSAKESTASFLEKATTLHFFMLLCAVFFTIDDLLVCFFDKNVLSLGKFNQIPELTIGNSLIFFLIFSFLMVVLFPLLRGVLSMLVFHISCIPGLNWLRREWEYNPNLTYPSIIRAKGIKEQNCIYLDIADASIRTQKRIERDLQVGFAASTLFLSNVLISSISKVPTISLVAYYYWKGFPQKSIQSFGLFVLGMTFCLAMIAYFWMSLGLNRDERVYFPSNETKKVNRSRIQSQFHK